MFCPHECRLSPESSYSQRARGRIGGRDEGGRPLRSRARGGSSEAADADERLAHRKDLPNLRTAESRLGGRGRRRMIKSRMRENDGLCGQQGAEQKPAAAASGETGD